MVMANPYMAGDKGLPQPVIALLMAGCIAAALSTAAGLLLVLSTSVSHDLMKKIIKPDISDKQEMRYARFASLGALLIAAYFGINPPSSFVAKTVAFAFGLAASSFFPTLIMGIFSKKVNKHGAIAGMITGIGFTSGYIVYFQFLTDSKEYWFGISPEGIGFVGMLINFSVAFVVSYLTPPPPREVQDMVENIRIPKGRAKRRSTDFMKSCPTLLLFLFASCLSPPRRKRKKASSLSLMEKPSRVGRERRNSFEWKTELSRGFSRQEGPQQRIPREQQGICRFRFTLRGQSWSAQETTQAFSSGANVFRTTMK